MRYPFYDGMMNPSRYEFTINYKPFYGDIEALKVEIEEAVEKWAALMLRSTHDLKFFVDHSAKKIKVDAQFYDKADAVMFKLAWAFNI